MKKFSLLTLLFLFIHIAGNAQNVNGSVTDAFTQKPIAGVSILPDGGSAISSDSSGKFELPCAGKPVYVTVRLRGYEELHVNVTNCNKPVKIEMVPSSVQLNEVQVNSWATEKNNNSLDQSKSIGVLTGEDLRRASGLSLQDALNLLPGVDMEYRTPFGGQRIMIRGYYGGGTNGNATPNLNFNGAGYSMYINDVPITDGTGITIMDDIDFSTLGKVEVIKGPQSSLYGAGIGGVVNLYTQRPEPNATVISQQAMGGSYGLWRTNTMVTTAGNSWDLMIDYGHQNYNGFRPNDASKKDYATFAAHYYASEKHTISAYASFSKSYEQIAGELDSAELYGRSDTGISSAMYAAHNSHVAIESYRAGITDKFQFNKHFSEQSTVFISGHTLDQPFAHGFTDYLALNYGGRTGFVYETSKKNVGVHGILGAAVLKSNQNSSGLFIIPAPIPNPNRPNTTENTALTANLFTEWKITLPLQFSITAGASVNWTNFSTRNMLNPANGQVWDSSVVHTQKFKPVVTPSFSVAKLFSDKASIYANVSFGYTPPVIGNIVNSLGQVNTSLKPERAIQYEIGTKGSWIHKKLSYQVAAFYTNIYNKLETEAGNIGGATYTYATNIGTQQNIGVEAALSYAIIENKEQIVSLVRPWVTFTYSDFTYKKFESNNNNASNTVDYSGKHVAGVAPIRFNAGFDFQLKYGLYLNATYQYVDKTPYTFDNLHYAKSYNLLSAKIGYHHEYFKHLGIDVYVGADNLLSSTYYSFVFIGENLNQISGDGYFLPAAYKPTVYGGGTISYKF